MRTSVEHGFEHEGMWITDRTKSPCGRFDLTEEESLKTYGRPKTQPAEEPATVPNFYDALADELNARTNQIDADWYALPTHYGATDVSYDFSVPRMMTASRLVCCSKRGSLMMSLSLRSASL